jgi:hypothetical protein
MFLFKKREEKIERTLTDLLTNLLTTKKRRDLASRCVYGEGNGYRIYVKTETETKICMRDELDISSIMMIQRILRCSELWRRHYVLTAVIHDLSINSLRKIPSKKAFENKSRYYKEIEEILSKESLERNEEKREIFDIYLSIVDGRRTEEKTIYKICPNRWFLHTFLEIYASERKIKGWLIFASAV